MNKKLFIERVSKESGLTIIESADAVEAVLDTIVRVVTEGGSVSVTGFGTFTSREWPARWARNPQTGERVRVKKTIRPVFRAGASFVDFVAGRKKLSKKESSIKKAPKGSVAIKREREAQRAESRAARKAERDALRAIVEGSR
jgi:DNA-binding protein HU-beta